MNIYSKVSANKFSWLMTLIIAAVCASCSEKPQAPKAPHTPEVSETLDAKAALQGQLNPWFFLGIWEYYPSYDDSPNWEKLWTEFTFDSNQELIVKRAKQHRKDGHIAERWLDHKATIEWLNSQIYTVDDDLFNWVLEEVNPFNRVTPIVDSPSKKDMWVSQLQGEIRRALQNLQWLFGGGAETAAFQQVEAMLQGWQGTDLSPAQLEKISAIEKFLAISKIGRSIISDDLDALESEIFTAKMKSIARQMKEFVASGASCAASLTDYGDLHALIFGKDMCTGESLSLTGRAISVMAIVAGNSAALRKILEKAGISGSTATNFSRKADEAVKNTQSAMQAIGKKKFYEIKNTPRGQRPAPETYLSEQYIKNHLRKFEGGGTRFIPKNQLEVFGPAQSDGTAFIIPKRDADKIISNANGSKRKIEKALGLEKGQLDFDVLVRIDIDSPHYLDLRIPSGNEKGANIKWLPGGALPEGGVEAVIDLSQNSTIHYNIKELRF